MESILLDTMFDLPSLEGVEEVVISREVVEGTARPLYIYADRAGTPTRRQRNARSLAPTWNSRQCWLRNRPVAAVLGVQICFRSTGLT